LRKNKDFKRNKLINPYTKKFFKNHLIKRDILREYASKIYEMYIPDSVIDVGCGPGFITEYFHEMGCHSIGLDYSIENVKSVASPVIHDNLYFCDVIKWEDNWVDYGKFDIAITWHMAEHVSEKYSDVIVKGMARFSDIIHWSAAQLGQKGVGHVNCQNPEYWEEKFSNIGYEVDKEDTKEWFEPFDRKYGESRHAKGIRDNARIFKRI
jgi:2-polyprenyl-3-methyl-5-hydroxy-6-metoxy-1,4-benzoquinol methylase